MAAASRACVPAATAARGFAHRVVSARRKPGQTAISSEWQVADAVLMDGFACAVLVEGLGVDGDAHAGITVQHLWDMQKDPTKPNLRQARRFFPGPPPAMAEPCAVPGLPLSGMRFYRHTLTCQQALCRPLGTCAGAFNLSYVELRVRWNVLRRAV